MSSYKQLALPLIALLSSLFVTAGALSPPAMAQQQNVEGAARTADVFTITAASPDSPVQQLVAQETARHLQALDVPEESAEELVVASLDDLVENWPSSAPDAENAENAEESSSDSSGAQELLGSLKPLAGLVRDHQAFLIPGSQGRDDLRDVLNRFRPGRGTINVGGLDAERQVDHLVAMMMMDAAGLDHTGMKYRQYDSMDTLARALLADEVQILSIPVSTAIQLPLSEGIAMVAFTGKQRQDVIIDTPTLLELQYDMTFTNYIGLYEQVPVGESASSTSPGSLAADLPDLSADISWPDQLYSLGLVDDYVNEGVFTANVLQQLSVLKDFQARIDS